MFLMIQVFVLRRYNVNHASIWHFDNLVWYAWTCTALIGNTFAFHKTLNWFDQYKRPQQWRDALMSRWFPNMECPLAGQLEIVGFAQPPFELIRRTKPCQDTAVKRHLPQNVWLLFICLWKKVYISTKIQATCFEEFLSTFSQDHHMISSKVQITFSCPILSHDWFKLISCCISSHAYAPKVNLSQCVPQKYD